MNYYLGKTSTKKSESISELMLAPPKQRVEIAQFDTRTLENFRLPEGQIFHRSNQYPQGSDELRKKRKVRAQTTRLPVYLIIAYRSCGTKRCQALP